MNGGGDFLDYNNDGKGAVGLADAPAPNIPGWGTAPPVTGDDDNIAKKRAAVATSPDPIIPPLPGQLNEGAMPPVGVTGEVASPPPTPAPAAVPAPSQAPVSAVTPPPVVPDAAPPPVSPIAAAPVIPPLPGVMVPAATPFVPPTSLIDPVKDLRSQVIPGTPSARTTAAQAATDAAAGAMTTDATNLAGDQGAAAMTALGVSPTAIADANKTATDSVNTLNSTDRQGLSDSLVQQYLKETSADPRLTKLQGQVDASASQLAGVDRYKMAQDEFDNFAQTTDPAFQKTLRDIMDREVGAGGFSGRINTSYGDAGRMRELDLRNERSTLLNKALSDSVQDALSKEGALSGLEGQLSGQELSRFATSANLGQNDASADMSALESKAAAARGVANDRTAAGESAQSTGTARAGQQLDTERSNLADRSALEGQSAGEDQSASAALRGERDYQVGQEGESYNRAVAEHEQEQQDTMTQFYKQLALLGAGESGNPAGEIGSLATQVNPGIDMATLAQLAQSAGYASGNQGGGAGTTDYSGLMSALQQALKGLPGGTPQGAQVPDPTGVV